MLDDRTKAELKSTVFRFLDPGQVRIFVFGSRAFGNFSKFSDIDLGLEPKTKIADGVVSKIEEVFENSDLPYRVDVVDFAKVSANFRKVAMKNAVYLN